MGYACPVCDQPHHDAEHLANHLAMTALTHGDDHEDWLDETVPDWSQESPEGLGERVAPHAASVPHETVFEDTTDRRSDTHDHDGPASAPRSGSGLDPDSETTQAALAEARRMRAETTTDRGDDPDGDDES